MSRYLIDTGPLAGLLLGRAGAARLIGPWIDQREVATSILCYGETYEYAMGFPDSAHLAAALRILVDDISAIAISREIVERYGVLRRELRPPRGAGLIGDIDTLIAATAFIEDLTIVTTDSDFDRVPGLRVILLHPRTFEVINRVGTL